MDIWRIYESSMREHFKVLWYEYLISHFCTGLTQEKSENVIVSDHSGVRTLNHTVHIKGLHLSLCTSSWFERWCMPRYKRNGFQIPYGYDQPLAKVSQKYIWSMNQQKLPKSQVLEICRWGHGNNRSLADWTVVVFLKGYEHGTCMHGQELAGRETKSLSSMPGGWILQA